MGTREYKVIKCELEVSDTQVRLRKDGGTPRPARLRFSPLELETATLLFLVDLLRSYRLRGDEANLLGEWLYRLLLADSFGDELHTALADKNTFLRIELVFEDPNGDLAKLPWEYLRRPATTKEAGYFLAAHEQAAVVRRPVVDCRPLRISGEQEPPRILFVASSPTAPGLGALDATGVKKEIQLLGKEPDKVKVMTLWSPYVKDPKQEAAKKKRPKATYEAFKEALNTFGPHVIHFHGHGRFNKENSRGEIAFMDDSYGPDWISGEKLKADLQKCLSVKLAFLQACESALEEPGQGPHPAIWSDAYQALSSVAGSVVQIGIPAIVAMQAKVENMAANTFARAFYQALVAGTPIYRAVQLARAASPDGAQPNEQFSCVPVLYLDTVGVNDEGILFGAPAAPAGGSPAPQQRKLPESIQCPWSPCKKVIAVSQFATELPEYCSKCGNRLLCENCRTPVSNVDADDQQYICTKCRRPILREAQAPAAPQRLQPASVPLSLGR